MNLNTMSLPRYGRPTKYKQITKHIYNQWDLGFAWDFHYLLIGLVCDLVVEKV
jgi:hypothetical protein